MLKIGFISLGCAKNLVDSERIIAMFNTNDFTIENNKEKCDVIVINTCGFIEASKKESIDTILEIAELKQKNLKKLIVCGCFVQRYLDQIKDEFPEVDAFIKIDDYPKLQEILTDVLKDVNISKYGEERVLLTNNYSAYLRISDGCDKKCAFCAIPLIRGKTKSIAIEELVKQAKILKNKGIKELNLIAQDSTYYGVDLYKKFALKELLVQLDEIGFKWIRVLYMYPSEIDDELLYTMKNLKSVVPYFDIPIQCGSSKILKLMNRPFDIDKLKKTINKIRTIFREPVLRTTLIVGFPHESDEDFNDTLNLVKELQFDSLGAFTYSKEEDTIAYDYEDEVKEEVKLARYEQLMQSQYEIVLAKNKEKIGKEYEVLVENYDSNLKAYVSRSIYSAPDGVDSYTYIYTDEILEIGAYYMVKIKDYNEYDLVANLKGEENE